MSKINFCQKCENYTMKNECSKCGNKTIRNIPPRYSPEDRNAKYRRKIKKDILKESGLL